jgi:hypothetical protein
LNPIFDGVAHGNIQQGRHGGKRQFMAPGGHFMAENDKSLL